MQNAMGLKSQPSRLILPFHFMSDWRARSLLEVFQLELSHCEFTFFSFCFLVFFCSADFYDVLGREKKERRLHFQWFTVCAPVLRIIHIRFGLEMHIKLIKPNGWMQFSYGLMITLVRFCFSFHFHSDSGLVLLLLLLLV